MFCGFLLTFLTSTFPPICSADSSFPSKLSHSLLTEVSLARRPVRPADLAAKSALKQASSRLGVFLTRRVDNPFPLPMKYERVDGRGPEGEELSRWRAIRREEDEARCAVCATPDNALLALTIALARRVDLSEALPLLCYCTRTRRRRRIPQHRRGLLQRRMSLLRLAHRLEQRQRNRSCPFASTGRRARRSKGRTCFPASRRWSSRCGPPRRNALRPNVSHQVAFFLNPRRQTDSACPRPISQARTTPTSSRRAISDRRATSP
jgi:hypothetical protein